MAPALRSFFDGASTKRAAAATAQKVGISPALRGAAAKDSPEKDDEIKEPQAPKAASFVPAIVSAAIVPAILPAFIPQQAPKALAVESWPEDPHIQSVLPPGKLQSQPEEKVSIPRSFADKGATLIRLTGLQTEIADQKQALEAKQGEIARLRGVLEETKKLTVLRSFKRPAAETRRDFETQLQEATNQKKIVAAAMEKEKIKQQAAFEAGKAEVAKLTAGVRGLVQAKEFVGKQLRNLSATHSELETVANNAQKLGAEKQKLIQDVAEMRRRVSAQIPRIMNLTAQKQQLEAKAAQAPRKMGQANATLAAMRAENAKLEEALAKAQGETKAMWESVGKLQKKAAVAGP